MAGCTASKSVAAQGLRWQSELGFRASAVNLPSGRRHMLAPLVESRTTAHYLCLPIRGYPRTT